MGTAESRCALRVVVAIAAVLEMAPRALASPCDGVDRKLIETRKPALARAISRQLAAKDVRILQVFRDDPWEILYVAPAAADETYLFYAGDPASTRFVAQWSGAAKADDEPEVRTWVEKNAPGIPRRLAHCFAWRVTHGRGR